MHSLVHSKQNQKHILRLSTPSPCRAAPLNPAPLLSPRPPPAGGPGPLVICSDCYDNANIYSRTREYCPYAYLGAEEDDVGLGAPRGPPREDATLEGLISQQDPPSSSTSYGGLLSPSHGERPGGLDPGECYATGESYGC